jgi:hypothetical protein
MKNLIIFALLASSTAAILARQSLELVRLSTATLSLQQQEARALWQAGELHSSTEAARKQVRFHDSQIRSLILESDSKSFPSPEPDSDPSPADRVWNNGHDYIWIAKKTLPALGIAPVRSLASEEDENIKLALNSRPVQKVLKELEANRARLSVEEAKTAAEDPEAVFRKFAAYRLPADTIDRLAGLMKTMTGPEQGLPIYRMNPAATVLLCLDAQQAARAFTVFTDFVSRVHLLERENLEVLPDSGAPFHGSLTNRISIRLKAFTEQGKALHNEFTANLQAIMGVERAQYWIKMSNHLIEDDLGSLGKYNRTLTLSFDGDGYRIEDVIGKRSNLSGGSGTARLSPLWRAFVKRTDTGYEVVK